MIALYILLCVLFFASIYGIISFCYNFDEEAKKPAQHNYLSDKYDLNRYKHDREMLKFLNKHKDELQDWPNYNNLVDALYADLYDFVNTLSKDPVIMNTDSEKE